jgi:hypothetical protein
MLTKNLRMSQGTPGSPGSPARPAYDETVTGTCYHTVIRILIPDPGSAITDPVILYAYVPYTCTTTVHHPAVPAVAPIAPTPPVDLSLAWNAGAYSIDRLDGDLKTEFQIPGGAGVFVGFVHSSDDVSYRRLTHSLYFHGGLVNVFESGSLVWGVTGFVPADVWKIERIAGVVKYYKNAGLLYTSLIASSGSLVVGSSLYAGGDRIN